MYYNFFPSLSNITTKDIPNEKLIITVDWHPDQDKDISKSFAKKSKNYWYGDVNFRAALSYEATKILTKVLKELEGQPKNLTRQKITEKVRFVTIESVIPPYTKEKFDENGDLAGKKNTCVTPNLASDDNKVSKSITFKLIKDCKYNENK